MGRRNHTVVGDDKVVHVGVSPNEKSKRRYISNAPSNSSQDLRAKIRNLLAPKE